MTPTGRRLPALGRRAVERAFDALAIVLIALVAWKLLIAPRFLAAAVERAPRTVVSGPHGAFRLGGASGRVVFLDFWATWCEPCRLSLPLVEAFERTHPDVDVIAIDVGEPPEVVARYAHEHGVANVAFDAQGRAASAYGIVGYPSMVVVDPKGFIRAKWTGFNPAIGVAMGNARGALSTTNVR